MSMSSDGRCNVPTSWRLHDNRDLAATHVNMANSLLAKTRARLLESGSAVAADNLLLPDGSKIEIVCNLVHPGPPPIEHSIVNIRSPYPPPVDDEKKKKHGEPLYLMVIYQGNKIAAINMDHLSDLSKCKKPSYQRPDPDNPDSLPLELTFINTPDIDKVQIMQIRSNHAKRNLSLITSGFSITESTDPEHKGLVLARSAWDWETHTSFYLHVLPWYGSKFISIKSGNSPVLNYNEDYVFTPSGVYYVDYNKELKTYEIKTYRDFSTEAYYDQYGPFYPDFIDADGQYYFGVCYEVACTLNHPYLSIGSQYVTHWSAYLNGPYANDPFGVYQTPTDGDRGRKGHTVFDYDSETPTVVNTPEFVFLLHEFDTDNRIDVLSVGRAACNSSISQGENDIDEYRVYAMSEWTLGGDYQHWPNYSHDINENYETHSYSYNASLVSDRHEKSGYNDSFRYDILGREGDSILSYSFELSDADCLSQVSEYVTLYPNIIMAWCERAQGGYSNLSQSYSAQMAGFVGNTTFMPSTDPARPYHNSYKGLIGYSYENEYMARPDWPAHYHPDSPPLEIIKTITASHSDDIHQGFIASMSPQGETADTQMVAISHASNGRHRLQFFILRKYQAQETTTPKTHTFGVSAPHYFLGETTTPYSLIQRYAQGNGTPEYYVYLNGEDVTAELLRILSTDSNPVEAKDIDIMLIDIPLEIIKSIV